MLKIKIMYDSKFSLSTTKGGESFLTGMGVLTDGANKNVKEIFKKENNFLQNVKELNKYYPNYQYADITKNTVMGILCRLIGEVRRLDSLDSSHPILSFQEKITFKNEVVDFQNEVMQLHTELKEVQNNAGGLIPNEKGSHFLLSKNAVSETLMNVFEAKDSQDLYLILDGMKNNDAKLFTSSYKEDIKAVTIIKEMVAAEEKMKGILESFYFEDKDGVYEAFNNRLYFAEKNLLNEFKEYLQENKDLKPAEITTYRKRIGVDEVFNIWGVIFAKKIRFLLENKQFEKEFDSTLNSKKSSIKGLAPGSGSLTIKDYYSNFVEDKKKSWTMPYQVDLKKDLFATEDLKEFNFGSKLGVTKESGILQIFLDIPEIEANQIIERIENAGVATFQLGKKGLAYVDTIELE